MKKIKKLLIYVLIIIFTILPNMSLAEELNPNTYNPTIGEVDEPFVTKYANNFTGILFTISIIISVISIMIVGLKYIVGSVEEKAEYKKNLIPIGLGIFVISFITAIVSAIAKLAESI